MTLFLDSCVLIYLIQGREPFARHAQQALRALAAPEAQIALSRLTRLECRVGPMQRNDQHTLALFDRFFEHPNLIWIELSRTVVELATEIRAHCGLKTPDALQAASCLQLGPDHHFVTGDRAFHRVAALNVTVL
ncbi:MAG TPA: PIN domain-containing protein [Castellaniella sp.]|uniref:type II toxin-antitoxin system VapC family toxin n=1 Tax=Castellaniella sp. TaxID=1955812 RepID=UPI002EF5DEFF